MKRTIEVNSRRPIMQPRQSHFTTTSSTSSMSGMRKDIQRDMEDEMNKRRGNWESKLDTMQRDFFNDGRTDDGLTKDFFGEVRGAKRTIPISTKTASSNDDYDINLIDQLYDTLDDGSKGYKMNFAIKGYKEEDLSINIEGRTVTLTATFEKTDATGSSNKKIINRKVDLPKDVDSETLSSNISDEGDVLVIEASLVKVAAVAEEESCSSSTTTTTTTAAAKPPSYETNKVDPTGLTGHIPYHRKKSSAVQYVEDSSFGEMFKLHLDMGTQYKVDDIKVHLLQTKFTIKAKSEVMSGGCRSINKWTRDFNMAKKVVELAAFYEEDTGEMYIYGAFSDAEDSAAAMQSGRRDVPIGAKQCEIVR